MDIATIGGLVTALGIIFGAIWHQTHGHVMAFYSTEGVLLVGVGAAAATMVSLPLGTGMDTWKIFMKCCFFKGKPLEKVVLELVEYASIARQQGILALESQLGDDPFLNKALRMVVDGQKAEDIELNLRLELIGMAERHSRGKKVFGTMGAYAPAFGLTATIIGQVVMFQNMGSDIAKIGGGLSVALLGTLYGCIFANVICMPLGDKLGVRSSEEQMMKEMIIQGVLGIVREESPTTLKAKLVSFLDARGAKKVSGD